MRTMFKVMPLVTAVTLAATLAACGGGEQKSAAGAAPAAAKAVDCGTLKANEICVKIGSGAPKTGGIAHLGKDNENGAQLAVNEINAKGGIKVGDKVAKLALVGEDDAGDPKTGTVVAQKLVDAKVVAVVGHLNSGVSIPANAIYAKAGLVQISPSSTNPDYTLKGNKTPKGSVSSYRVVATDAQQGPAVAKFMVSKGAKNIAIIDDATQYGKGLADQVETAAKAGGSKIAAREAATKDTKDFKAVLTKIKASNPDWIFWGGMDDTAAALAKQMKELGITAKLASGDGACTDKFVELAGAAGKGTICSEAGMPVTKMPKGADFIKAYETAFAGQKVQIYSPFSYDAVYVIAKAIEVAGSADPEAIAAAMPKVKIEGVIGPISFDAKGDVNGGAVTLYEITDKKNVLEIIK